LGEDEVSDQPNTKTDSVFEKGQTEMIPSVGGSRVWDALSHSEKALKSAMIIKNGFIFLGESTYVILSEEDK
jgi:hypothetical protein